MAESRADTLATLLRDLELPSTACAGAKPEAALLVPGWLDAEAPEHQRELRIAVELLAVLCPSWSVRLVEDLDLLAGCSFAVCVLDRALAARAAERLPTRLVGSDTLRFDARKWRLTFRDPRREAEVAARAPSTSTDSGVPTALHLDGFVPPDSLDELAARVRSRLTIARVLVSGHQTATATAAMRRAFGAAVDELTAEAQLSNGVEHLVSTDLATLQLLRGPRRKSFLSPALTFSDASALSIPRQDLFLYKGEELGALRLSTLLLAPHLERASPREHVRPLVSVIVPVYDRTHELLRLARSLLVQRYARLEVLFVTNGSPPETLDAIRDATVLLMNKRIRVQTISFPRPFGCATVPRDVGCYAARGAFLCFLDSDDYLEPGFFDVFAEGPVSDEVIWAPKKIYRDGGRDMGPDFRFDRATDGVGDVPDGLYVLLRRLGNVFSNSGVIIPREAFVRAGGIDHSLRYCEDYYLWLRLARLGLGAREHAGAVDIVLHPGNNELAVGQPEWFFMARDAAEREQVF